MEASQQAQVQHFSAGGVLVAGPPRLVTFRCRKGHEFRVPEGAQMHWPGVALCIICLTDHFVAQGFGMTAVEPTAEQPVPPPPPT